MKIFRPIAALFVAVATLAGCTEDTFAPSRVITPEMAKPKNLKYSTVINARQTEAISTGIPTVETGGLIPNFEIVSVRDAGGNILGEDYTKYLSIISPTIIEIGKYDNGEPIEAVSYRKAGTIKIEAGHPFGRGEYSFDIAVTTILNGTQYRTQFDGGFKLSISPNMPPALLYIPMAQNLVFGAGTSSSAPYVKVAGENIIFSLGDNTDKLTIDPATGKMSIKEGFTSGTEVSVTPTIIVTNTLSNESKTFKGSESLITIVISSTPVTMPLRSNYFFLPQFGEAEALSKITIVTAGAITGSSLWGATTSIDNGYAAMSADRPKDTGNVTTAQIGFTAASNSKPHESWLIFKPQDLTLFDYGFDIKAIFWVQNYYITYIKTAGHSVGIGGAAATITPMISTTYDYTSTTINPTDWSEISDDLACKIYNGANLVTSTTGMPYPGDNATIANDQTSALKDPALRWDNPRWLRCELDLSPWKDCKNFTLAIRAFTDVTLTGTTQGRAGRYYVGSVYYEAIEKPAP